jgi:hypothetical protein
MEASKQSEGGKARAEKLSKEERREIARKGALARWGKKAESNGESTGGTDEAFELRRPGFYEFCVSGSWDRGCRRCGKKFRTRLEMNDFCSPECRGEFLERFARRGA